MIEVLAPATRVKRRLFAIDTFPFAMMSPLISRVVPPVTKIPFVVAVSAFRVTLRLALIVIDAAAMGLDVVTLATDGTVRLPSPDTVFPKVRSPPPRVKERSEERLLVKVFAK